MKSFSLIPKIATEHGNTGILLQQVLASARRGWILFYITAGLFVIFLLIVTIKPSPILAISDDGQYLGEINDRKDLFRSRAQIEAAAETISIYYLSKNSASVLSDMSAVMAIMDRCPDTVIRDDETVAEIHCQGDKKRLFERQLEFLQSSSYLQNIAGADVYSWIEPMETNIVSRAKELVVVRVSGNIVVNANKGNTKEIPYSGNMFLAPSPRNRLDRLGYLGFKFIDYKDNE